MQVVAGIVLPWVHNSGKASDELFHRAASALHRTQRFQPCPLRRNACLQAPAPYAIALGNRPAWLDPAGEGAAQWHQDLSSTLANSRKRAWKFKKLAQMDPHKL